MLNQAKIATDMGLYLWAREEYEKGNILKCMRIFRVFCRRVPTFEGGLYCIPRRG